MVPLMIFEPRYRVLFNTLLDGETGVDEGLVQKESPWRGTKVFGLCFVDDKSRLASVGTSLQIMEHVQAEDGRLYITNKGIERFRIVEVVKERPVLICEVEVLDEDDDVSDEVKSLSEEVASLFRETLRMSVKMQQVQVKPEQLEPEELVVLGPKDMSYWIASAFNDSRHVQQTLLEETSTVTRLQREKEILTQTLKFYSAATAVQSVFKEGPSEPQQPPPGGPD